MPFRPIYSGLPWSVRLAVPALLLAAAVGLFRWTEETLAYAASPYPIVATIGYHEVAQLAYARADMSLSEATAEFALRRGETLSSVLGDLGLDGGEANRVTETLAEYADMRRLKPADRYSSRVDSAGRVAEFVLVLGGRGRVRARRQRDGAWASEWDPFDRRVVVRSVAGELDGALETAIEVSGGEPSLAFRMADVLQWDIDFTRDLRRGDRFEILYQQVYLDGAFHSVGDILALEYTNGDRRIQAYRFGEDDTIGYYDAEGRPMRKMFLRSPMQYSRITSRFSKRRFHPVLKRYRPHYGVDYGAPTGTPARVTANGVVTFAGWDRGGGNTVKVRHPNGYLTAYLHLSRFGKGIKPGRRVAQGEVIGYVGSTGLATGPHLDYRVMHGGRWIDPLSLKAVPADPIPTSKLAEFSAMRDRYREQLAGAALGSVAPVRVAERSVASPATGSQP